MRLHACLWAVALPLLVLGCQTIGRAGEQYEVCDDPIAADAYQRARIHIDAGEFAAALPLLLQTIVACPDFVVAHELFQDSAAKVGEGAEGEMRQSYAQLEGSSYSPLLPYLRSRLSDNNRDRLKLLDQAILRDNSFFRAYLARAEVFRQLRRTDRALDELRNAIQARPSDVDANLAIAEVLAQLGRYREAARHYQVLERLSSGSQSIRKDYLALLIYQLGELADAEKIVEDLLAFDDLDVETLMDKAAIAWLREEFEISLQIYQRILRIDSSQSEAVLNIGNLYYQGLARGTDEGRRRYWPKARLAYLYYLEHCRAATGFDQLDRWLGVPVRLREITSLLGDIGKANPRLGDFD